MENLYENVEYDKKDSYNWMNGCPRQYKWYF